MSDRDAAASSSEPDYGPSRGRAVRLVGLLLVGVVLGAVVTLAIQDRGVTGRAAIGEAAPDAADGPGDPASDRGSDGSGPPTRSVLVVWAADPLPDGVADGAAALPDVEQTVAVGHGPVGLVASGSEGGPPTTLPVPPSQPGSVVPLDAVTFTPDRYATFVPPELAASFAGLTDGEVVLSRTGAALRGAAVGDELDLVHVGVRPDQAAPPTVVRVAAIVDDAVIGGAEAAVGPTAGAALGISAPRYLLVAHHGDRGALERGLRALVPDAVRVRGPGETPFLRDGDAVLPQATVKAAFGEFPVTWDGTGAAQVGSWAADNLVDADLPVLGSVRCHRAVLDDLRAAMEQIEREQLDYLIDPTPSSRACWYPDVIDRSGALSRGYWGIAVVLNSVKNPTGSGSVQDPRIVAIMQEHGFTWGGHFLVPEPAYFEHVGTGPFLPTR